MNKIKRRTFIIGALAAQFASLIPLQLKARPLKSRDAVLHLDQNNVLHIHSGAGHAVTLGENDFLKPMLEVFSAKSQIHYGENPTQLPFLLAQNLNHLSFTNKKTNVKAMAKLKDVLNGDRLNYIENTVSQATLDYIQNIEGKGIVVAVGAIS